ncbi:MAG: pyrroline-5-carboxylate reductase [Burkholderiales bacterium]|jgi:pyrroline-5-carboxylate reductase|nr:pyrroline-5-carboxylate reductase [Burkholderiales bacterium]
MQITFIGGGNMAAALIGGMIAKGFPAQSIRVVELLHEARARLAEQFGVRVFERMADAAPFGDLAVLAVKPQQMHEVAREAGRHVGATTVLSVAAGIRLADLARWLGGQPALARCMPNTPALIGLGITGLYAAPDVPAATRGAMQTLLEAVGKVVWVESEALLDPVTAVSASGPAYFFYFIEALEQAARELGLAPETARALAIETARGAGELAARSSEPPGVLRERVTSKGGTTERALATMNADGVRAAIVRAVKAASERAGELGDEFGRP